LANDDVPLRLLGDGAAIETARRSTSKLFDVAAAAVVLLLLYVSLMMITRSNENNDKL